MNNDRHKKDNYQLSFHELRQLEIVEALGELSDIQKKNLEMKARKVTNFGVCAGKYEDVLQETFKLVIQDKLPWKPEKNPDIYDHLIKSIPNTAQRLRRKLLLADRKTPRFLDLENDDSKFWKNLLLTKPEVWNNIEKKDLVKKIFNYFEDDSEIVNVMDLWLQGYDKMEILEKTDLTSPQFETVRRRIKRNVQKLREYLGINRNEQ